MISDCRVQHLEEGEVSKGTGAVGFDADRGCCGGERVSAPAMLVREI